MREEAKWGLGEAIYFDILPPPPQIRALGQKALAPQGLGSHLLLFGLEMFGFSFSECQEPMTSICVGYFGASGTQEVGVVLGGREQGPG